MDEKLKYHRQLLPPSAVDSALLWADKQELAVMYGWYRHNTRRKDYLSANVNLLAIEIARANGKT